MYRNDGKIFYVTQGNNCLLRREIKQNDINQKAWEELKAAEFKNSSQTPQEKLIKYHNEKTIKDVLTFTSNFGHTSSKTTDIKILNDKDLKEMVSKTRSLVKLLMQKIETYHPDKKVEYDSIFEKPQLNDFNEKEPVPYTTIYLGLLEKEDDNPPELEVENPSEIKNRHFAFLRENNQLSIVGETHVLSNDILKLLNDYHSIDKNGRYYKVSTITIPTSDLELLTKAQSLEELSPDVIDRVNDAKTKSWPRENQQLNTLRQLYKKLIKIDWKKSNKLRTYNNRGLHPASVQYSRNVITEVHNYIYYRETVKQQVMDSQITEQDRSITCDLSTPVLTICKKIKRLLVNPETESIENTLKGVAIYALHQHVSAENKKNINTKEESLFFKEIAQLIDINKTLQNILTEIMHTPFKVFSGDTIEGKPVPSGVFEIYNICNDSEIPPEEKLSKILDIAARKLGEIKLTRRQTTVDFYKSIVHKLLVLKNDLSLDMTIKKIVAYDKLPPLAKPWKKIDKTTFAKTTHTPGEAPKEPYEVYVKRRQKLT